MSITLVKYCDIPLYLRSGDYYRSLPVDNPYRSFCVPEDCFRMKDTEVSDYNDVCRLLNVSVFWQLDEIPFCAKQYCWRNGIDIWEHAFFNLPGAVTSGIMPTMFNVHFAHSKMTFMETIKCGLRQFVVHAPSNMNKQGPATTLESKAVTQRILNFVHEELFDWRFETRVISTVSSLLEQAFQASESGILWNLSASPLRAQVSSKVSHYMPEGCYVDDVVIESKYALSPRPKEYMNMSYFVDVLGKISLLALGLWVSFLLENYRIL